jgi:hypothetical protein
VGGCLANTSDFQLRLLSARYARANVGATVPIVSFRERLPSLSAIAKAAPAQGVRRAAERSERVARCTCGRQTSEAETPKGKPPLWGGAGLRRGGLSLCGFAVQAGSF